MPLKIIINTIDKGEHLLVMTSDGDLLFSREQLAEFGFKEIPQKATTTEGGRVSLKSLAPEVSFTLNTPQATLIMMVEPKLLKKYVIDMAHKRPEKVMYTKENTAFLNYAINYSLGDRLDFQSLSVPTEIGVRLSDYLVYSSFSSTQTRTENKFVRMMTNIISDDTVNIRRYTAGDFFAFSGALGGSGILGGLSMTKNFSIDPYFMRYQGLYLSGLLQTPSEIDLFINNVSIKKEKLPPGQFDLSNLYGQTGAGNATLVIKDAFGREQILTTPFYLSSNLLRAGLHDYSYNIGFKRLDLGMKSFDYKKPAFLGYHRYGFGETFTGGMRAEIDKEVLNFGPLATFLVGRSGEIDSAVALSRDSGRYGSGAFLSYSYNGSALGGNVSFRYFSRDYANLSLKELTAKPHFEGRAGIGFHTQSLGSISGSVQFLSRYGQTDTKSVNLFYNKTLGSRVSLSVAVSRRDEIKTSYNVFTGLIFILGQDHFGTLNVRSEDSQKTVSASIEKNPPRGTGLGYKFELETKDNENWKPGGLSYFQYRGRYGIYSANVRRISGANSYDLNLSGGVAFVNNSLYFSRPISDSFALVRVGDVEGARVYYSNQEVGITNGKGETLVPEFVSYNDNKISFEASDIPVNYEFAELEKYVSPAYRSGSIVNFEITKLQAFEGRLFLVRKGEKKPAESAVLEIGTNAKSVEAVIGKRGEFYIENLKPGKFPAKMTLEDKQCRFEMTVPESKEMNVNLGEISCEMD